ncbi:tubulin-tyrosine ligase family protein [Nitzschia inconspicua]|uniref:Tubulin-tyrosine ligase family protein n=1 Tax=Nitzschia inconspicua TaxID=303405 RepID=A0A9K3KTR0_9STRA|nr:tubulin-tyrosine ligase family protein [Nitzschia inconspicua]
MQKRRNVQRDSRRHRPYSGAFGSTTTLLLILAVVSITISTISIVFQHRNASMHQMVMHQLEEEMTTSIGVWKQTQQRRRRRRDAHRHLQRMFTPVPDHAKKLFWMKFSPHHKLYEPVARAFHSRGWSLTRQQHKAHVIWRDQPTSPRGIYTRLQPWQRYNQLPHTDAWDDKDALAQRMEEYYKETDTEPLHSFPESYVLHQPKALQRFQQRLNNGGGLDIPWVLKQPTVNMGEGVTILGPQSKELKNIVKTVQKKLKDQTEDSDDEDPPRLVIQQYICNEMTYKGRKFDFRVFWMVASVDPLLVLYHTQHNYVRIGHALYDESNFASTKSHLTTHTFGAEEGKLTWEQFRAFVQEQYDKTLKPQLSTGELNNIPRLLHPSHAKPFQHVEQQIKTVLSHIVDAYKDITFHSHPHEMTSENVFTVHAADMILDNNFDVFLIEGTDGPGKDEDYDFRIDMHNAIFGEMVDILEYIVQQQENGKAVDVDEMKEIGIFGGYDVIYNQQPEEDQAWMFDYRFERLPQKGCGGHSSQFQVVESTESATDTLTQSTAKTFYMPGRVFSDGEPVTRSFRRLGYRPVDDIADAQIIYNRVENEHLPSERMQPYQFVSPFPNEVDIFHHLETYLDRTMSRGVVCNPLFYNGSQDRRFQIVVYWLILSTDPLLALYHDGFIYLPYSANDEMECISAAKGEVPTWRGSWISLEKQLRQQQVKFSGRETAMDHVRGQLKQALVPIARVFATKATQYNQLNDIAQRHFGLFGAEFEIDHNLNVFLTQLHDDLVAGEQHQYIVDLHDELYGKTLGILECLNSTAFTTHGRNSRQSWETTLEILTHDKMGGFQWLVRPATSAGQEQWTFQHYSGKQRARECKSKVERLDITEDAINWEKQRTSI